MSWLTSDTEMLSAASGDLACVGATMAVQNAVAAVPTNAVVSPACDVVSNLVAAHFVVQAQQYQALAAMAEEIHSQVVSNLHGSASSYTTTEFGNAHIMG